MAFGPAPPAKALNPCLIHANRIFTTTHPLQQLRAVKDPRLHSMKCPVAGCNQLVALSGLQDDTDAVVAVEAYRRRLEASKKRKRVVEDDEGGDDGDDGA